MQSAKLQVEVMDTIAVWLLGANIGVVQAGAVGLHVAGFLSASISVKVLVFLFQLEALLPFTSSD